MFIPQLNILRFLAALAIVIFHYGLEDFSGNGEYLYNLFATGSQAVTFFFFLSGFVLYVAYHNREVSFWSFMKSRVARIQPLYLFAFVACLMLVLTLSDHRPRGDSIILQLLSLHAWVPGKALEINYPSWSLSVEMFFYILFPFILKLKSRLNTNTFTVLVLAVWLVSQLIYMLMVERVVWPDVQDAHHVMLYNPLLHLSTFLFGLLSAHFFLVWKKKDRIRYTSSIWLTGMLIWLSLMMTNNQIIHYSHNGLLAPIYAIILIGISMDSGQLVQLLSRKIFVEAGNISYAIYILQAAVALVLINELSWGFLPFLLVLIAFSAFMYYYFEKPAQRWIKK